MGKNGNKGRKKGEMGIKWGGNLKKGEIWKKMGGKKGEMGIKRRKNGVKKGFSGPFLFLKTWIYLGIFSCWIWGFLGGKNGEKWEKWGEKGKKQEKMGIKKWEKRGGHGKKWE